MEGVRRARPLSSRAPRDHSRRPRVRICNPKTEGLGGDTSLDPWVLTLLSSPKHHDPRLLLTLHVNSHNERRVPRYVTTNRQRLYRKTSLVFQILCVCAKDPREQSTFTRRRSANDTSHSSQPND